MLHTYSNLAQAITSKSQLVGGQTGPNIPEVERLLTVVRRLQFSAKPTDQLTLGSP